MSILIGESEGVQNGALKTYTFTYPAPVVNDFSGSPLTLPTSEPGTAQFSYTIQASDFPTITPAPTSVKFLVCAINAGRVPASTTTLNYRILKNGASVTTGNMPSITANNYWTFTHWRWFDVQVGDVIEVKTWSNIAGATYDYSAVLIQPTQVYLSKPNAVLSDVTIVIPNAIPITGGTSGVWTSSNVSFYPANTALTPLGLANATHTLPVFMPHAGQGFFKAGNGDVNGQSVSGNGSHGSVKPFYQRNYMPSSISFREMKG